MQSVSKTESTLDLTVCICTRDRPADLIGAVQSVLDHAPNATVCISEDGSVLAPAEIRRAPGCRWLKGPGRGLGANRNAVVRAAKSQWILFMDDDARLGKTFVRAIEDCLLEIQPSDRSKAIITGRELNCGKLVAPSDTDFLGFQSREYLSRDARHTVVINAAIWPRTLFEHVGFDENLRYGSDEVDLAYSALTAGFKIWDCPDAINIHNPSPQGRSAYMVYSHASRLRATTKRYWCLKKKRIMALAYILIAPTHLCISLTRREGVAGLVNYTRVLRLWLFPS